MTNAHKDALFVLVKSLSKSEKRQFKLYVGRLGVNTDAKFLALFNLLDKMKAYNEKVILESGIVKKTQLLSFIHILRICPPCYVLVRFPSSSCTVTF